MAFFNMGSNAGGHVPSGLDLLNLSSSLFEPLGAQQVIFPDLQTIENLTKNAALSRKRKAAITDSDSSTAVQTVTVDPSTFPNAFSSLGLGGINPLMFSQPPPPQQKQNDSNRLNDHEIDFDLIKNEEDALTAGPLSKHGRVDDHDSDNDTTQPQRRKPGRKLAQTEPTNKRTAQNRAAQRAFRERKEKYVKDLEARVQLLESMTKGNHAKSSQQGGVDSMELITENKNLKQRISHLESENTILREMTFSFDFSAPAQPQPLVNAAQLARSSNSQQQQQQQQPQPGSTTPFMSPPDAISSSAGLLGQLLQPSSGSSLKTTPNDLFSIFDSPAIGLPDDLSIPLPGFAPLNSPAPTTATPPLTSARASFSPFTPALSGNVGTVAHELFAAQQRQQQVQQAQQSSMSSSSAPASDMLFSLPQFTQFRDATANAATAAADDINFDMDAFLNSSPASADAEFDALLGVHDETEFHKHKDTEIGRDLPEQLPEVCCENQSPEVIDELCEIFKSKAQCTEMQQLQNTILDACNAGDQARVMEMVEICRRKKEMYLLRRKAGVTVS